MRDLERERVLQTVRAGLLGDAPTPVTLGNYQILDRIGSGGTSVVYAAYDPRLDRKVAVKIVSQVGPVSDVAVRSRLLREGRALARLSHPNVVAVYDVGEQDGCLFLVVQLVEGENLTSWCGRERRSVDEVLEVMLAAGEGLAAAHDLGLVHRDVKPQTLLLDARGTVRVADFGLVSPTGEVTGSDAASPAAPPLPDTRLTRTGAVLGTPAYMAPEQWLGGAVDARTDQFSYCVAFYEALYGVHPFRCDRPEELRERVLNGRICEPPADLEPAPPEWLREILERGLRPNAAQRYPTIADLLADLRAHHASVRATGGALTKMARLARLVAEDDNPTEFAPLAAECRLALDQALASWPDNPDAQQGVAELERLSVTHELRHGTIETITALLEQLPAPPVQLQQRLHTLQAEEENRRDRMEKLERFERETSLYIADRFKIGATAFVAIFWGIVLAAFALMDDLGVYSVSNYGLAAFFAGNFMLTIASNIAFAAHAANQMNRELSLVSLLGYLSHTLLFLLAGLLDLTLGEAFAFVHLVTGVFWGVVTITHERRAFVVPPLALLGAAATVLFPAWALWLGAFASFITFGGLSLSFWIGARRVARDSAELDAA